MKRFLFTFFLFICSLSVFSQDPDPCDFLTINDGYPILVNPSCGIENGSIEIEVIRVQER